ncbi:KpsF/GutQ family sugar-phosphate isomerase [Desulfonema magnum]|uniref:Arabinose 5-phosphate isomerase n=1 Tax=Desulfonema magnum TaxID=45655 RepID=A0A975BKR3_9BACT|nr:KpsF/GutQ family sugar-phosphate isomerase [Desulfonema magnum]QTA86905.1 Arabinose 5-phosphate isomerase [Desulfonema magnum]
MIIKQAIEVLDIEAKGILELKERIDKNFVKMAEIICNSTGRLIVAGIGKSGIVGRKIVATLNSTGTRSIFLHPVEAMHGDLGIVGQDDVFLALSNSGETDELNILLPSIRSVGCKIIAFTGRANSTLATHSDIVIDVGVKKEACPLGLAPTASTTAMLAMGDALAVVLINKKHFKKSDFKKIHPGGALGQRLSGSVKDIMLTGEELPLVFEGTTMEEAVREIDRPGLGVTFILKSDKTLCGIITDGDIRRLIARKEPIFEMAVEDVMTQNPKTVHPDSPAYDALNIMEEYEITVLPVTNLTGKVQGVLHLHDILGKGAFKFNGT